MSRSIWRRWRRVDWYAAARWGWSRSTPSLIRLCCGSAMSSARECRRTSHGRPRSSAYSSRHGAAPTSDNAGRRGTTQDTPKGDHRMTMERTDVIASPYGFGRTLTVGFDEAITKVTEALKAEGFGVLTTI